MSKRNVDKFLELMQKDEGLARKMAACLYKLETNEVKAEGSGDFITREIVPLAKEYGFEFTAQDFLDYTNEATAKVGLSAEDLAEVSGGKGGVRAALMGTLALLGVTAAPAAVEMISGGEVAPFSMVASAATPQTEEQKAELELVLAGLYYLGNEVASSDLKENERNELYEKIDPLILDIEDAISDEVDEEVDVADLISRISNLVAEVKNEGVKSEWWSAKDKIDEVVTELAQYLDEGLIFSKDATNIKENLVALKTSLTEKKLTSKKLKEIKQCAEDFQEKLYDVPSPKKIVKKLKSEKEELAKKIGKEITSLKERNNTTTNDAIGDLEKLKSRLETEVVDLTPENVLDKEKIVKEVQDKFGEISKKIDNAIDLNFDIQQTKTELSKQLDLIKKQREMQKRTDHTEDKQKINDIEQRINKLDKGITYNTVEEKAAELKALQLELEALRQGILDFEKNLSTYVAKPKKNIGEMLTFYKNDATKANDKDILAEIEKLEQELAAISEQPTSQKELIEIVVKLKNITKNIPQIKETLEKATDLKEIAEQVNADFAEVFDNIIKEIEAADSVYKINLAKEKLSANEQVLVEIMKEKINEANKTAHILHEIAKIFELNQLKGNFLNLIDTFDRFNYGAAPTAELYKVYQDVETVNIAENELKNYLGKQIDDLVKQANELKDQANGVDDDLKKSFEDTATNLRAEKENLLKKLDYAARTVSTVRESLAERQGELLPKIALKNQIATLKAQATKLKDMATGVDDYLVNAFDGLVTSLGEIELNGDLQKITTDFNQVKNLVNERAKEFAQKLSEEIDELLKNEVMGAEIQDELKAIKAALPKGDKADTASVVKAIDDVTAVKTKMANKLLEWHKILSEYHNKGYHKEGVETEVVKINLDQLDNLTNQMLNGADGIKLDAETLNTATALAKEIADNLNTDIAGAVDTVQRYEGFHRADHTAAVQANTLVTFLRNEVGDVHALKFVDKETRAKLAKDIKHIFDQIKIDRETGKYYLPRFYNWYAVNHDDLKLICEAYGVVADDFGERVVYRSPKEGKGLTFKDQADVLVQALSQVQRLDLFDVSPESREALKNDILEIGAKIKSTPGWLYGQTLSLEGIDQKETKNMQDGLARILEFYNYINGQK